MKTMIHRYKYSLLLFAILILAAVFRFIGAGWGLPLLLHPDEGTIVNAAVRMARRHSFEPDVFFRPDHLEIQLNMIQFVLLSHVFFHLPIGQMATQHLDVLYLAARLLTGCFGTGMVLLAYLIGTRRNRLVGLVAALLFALFPLFVTHSHWVTPDIPTGFFMLLAILLCIRYLEQPNALRLALICLSTALFLAVKYPGLILCAFIALTILAGGIRDRNPRRAAGHLLLAIPLVPGFLFLISPVLFTNYSAVLASLRNEANPNRPGADGLGYWGNVLFYLKNGWTGGGLMLLLLGLVGLLALIRRKELRLLPITYSFIYLLALSFVGLHWERRAVPMLVSPLLLAAFGIEYVYQSIARLAAYRRTGRILFSLCLGLVLLNLAAASAARTVTFLVPDTRALGLHFCRAAKMTSVNTNYEGYTPLDPGRPKNLDSFIRKEQNLYIGSRKIKYIVLSDLMYSRYTANPQRFPAENFRYRALAGQYRLIKKYRPAVLHPSAYEPINIVRSFSYIRKLIGQGQSGPLLKFYQAGRNNYLQKR